MTDDLLLAPIAPMTQTVGMAQQRRALHVRGPERAACFFGRCCCRTTKADIRPSSALMQQQQNEPGLI